MLEGIRPLPSSDLLHALVTMGHGEALAIVEAGD
jgi:L-fucose mutarotase/ribose pyranase (RbsD/FucU family)